MRRLSVAQAGMAAVIVVFLIIPAYGSGLHFLRVRDFCWRGCGPVFLYGELSDLTAFLIVAMWMFLYPALLVVQLVALVLGVISLATRRDAMRGPERLLHLAIPLAVVALLMATWRPVLTLVRVVVGPAVAD
jgi:hypothetical protein